jgi:hypothetical protein
VMEEWRTIPGYEGFYEASSEGRIRSVDRMVDTYSHRGARPTKQRRKGKVLSQNIGPHGYLLTCLTVHGRSATKRVNVLVCAAFHGSRPDEMDACHCDGDRLNNRADNMRWDTPFGNAADKIAHGTEARGARNGNAKLRPDQVLAIRASTSSAKSLAAEYGVSPDNILLIRSRKSWAWLGDDGGFLDLQARAA